VVAKLQHFFASDQSFLDPQISKDGKPYGPKRFKEIVRECWYVSDNLHTSYTDVLDLSVQERIYLIENIHEKYNAQRKAMEEIHAKNKIKK
jgi:hypothetical protein